MSSLLIGSPFFQLLFCRFVGPNNLPLSSLVDHSPPTNIRITIPLHILQVIEPYGYWLRELEQIMARFFWGTVGQQKKIHWVSWKNKICLPLDEGGLGIRRLPELVTAFSIKLWWRFLSQDSLWAQYTLSKYCNHRGRVFVAPCSSHDSPIWRRLTVIREHVHCFNRWSLGEGKISFWDNVWVGDRPLRTYCQPGTTLPSDEVACFLRDGTWHDDKLHRLIVITSLKIDAFLVLTDSVVPSTNMGGGSPSCPPKHQMYDHDAPKPFQIFVSAPRH